MKRKYVDEVCGICLSEHRSIVALSPCMHEFCLECVSSWLISRLLCPLCKQPCFALLHSLSGDLFGNRLAVNKKDFAVAWAKRDVINRHFEARNKNIKSMTKVLYNALRATKITIEVTRRWIYMCGMKTVVHRKYISTDNIDKMPMDPGHKIWQWLQVELAIFCTSSEIRSFIKFAKSEVSSYATLNEVVSEILSKVVISKFLHEMNSFLSYCDSCESYYRERNIKMIVGRLKGQSLDTIIIKDGEICLQLLSKLIIENIFILEHESKGVDCNFSTVEEISHIEYLVVCSSQCSPSQFLFHIQEFIKIRLQRIGKSSRHSLLSYIDCHKFSAQYLPLYLYFFNNNKSSQSNEEPCSLISRNEPSVDLTSEQQSSVIDLTQDDC